jgi:hypothetical protein
LRQLELSLAVGTRRVWIEQRIASYAIRHSLGAGFRELDTPSDRVTASLFKSYSPARSISSTATSGGLEKPTAQGALSCLWSKAPRCKVGRICFDM